ncbi:MAG: hypothetical protein IJ637_08375 [Prevotella sp.]|nr:hypothetical protein [Prevotella sp.]
MKKIIMTMVALISMTAAMAQQSDNNKGELRAPRQITPEDVTNRMAQQLSLTDDQKTKVLKLNNEYKDVLAGPGMGRGPRGPRPDGQTGATQQQGQQQDKSSDKKAKTNDQQEQRQRPELTDEQKAQMQQNMQKRKEYNAKLKQILTDEQYQKYQQQHRRRGFGGQGGPRGGRGQRQSMSQNN